MITLLTQFNSLVETMKRYDLYQPNDEVDTELQSLEALIVDAERRQELIENTASEIEKTISKYTEAVDGKTNEIDKILTLNDHDAIQSRANEIVILCDLSDKTPYDDEWFRENKKTVTHRLNSILEDLAIIEENTKGEDLSKLTSKGCELITHFVNIKIACDLDDDESNNWVVSDKVVSVKQPTKQSFEIEVTELPIATAFENIEIEMIVNLLRNLKDGNGVDGETMECILVEVGMTSQMLHQLALNADNGVLEYLLKERTELYGNDYVGKFSYNICEGVYYIDLLYHPTRKEMIFNSIDDIIELVSLNKATWLFSKNYVGTLILEFLIELEKENRYFNFDGTSGSCYVEKGGSDKVIYCTPFWEEVDGVPISVDIEGTSVYNHLIDYKYPTDLGEVLIFQEWYKNLLKTLLEQY